MKFARRSVSDQDIRRYEMFAQVCITKLLPPDFIQLWILRICNNLGRLALHSNSPKTKVEFRPGMVQLREVEQILDLVKMLLMMIYMHESQQTLSFLPLFLFHVFDHEPSS